MFEANRSLHHTITTAAVRGADGEIQDGVGWLSQPLVVVIIAVPCLLFLLIVTIATVVGMVVTSRRSGVLSSGRRREREDEVGPEIDCEADRMSVISRNPSLITFDSKCYRDDGTPTAPRVWCQLDHSSDVQSELTDFTDFESDIYANTPINQMGMGREWVSYLGELHALRLLDRLIVARVDGERWAMSASCDLRMPELAHVYRLLNGRACAAPGVAISQQGRYYVVLSSGGGALVARAQGEAGRPSELLYAVCTRQFVLVGVVSVGGAGGTAAVFERFRSEIQRLRQHIYDEGL